VPVAVGEMKTVIIPGVNVHVHKVAWTSDDVHTVLLAVHAGTMYSYLYFGTCVHMENGHQRLIKNMVCLRVLLAPKYK
jgi:hypothetical protein